MGDNGVEAGIIGGEAGAQAASGGDTGVEGEVEAEVEAGRGDDRVEAVGLSLEAGAQGGDTRVGTGVEAELQAGRGRVHPTAQLVKVPPSRLPHEKHNVFAERHIEIGVADQHAECRSGLESAQDAQFEHEDESWY